MNDGTRRGRSGDDGEHVGDSERQGHNHKATDGGGEMTTRGIAAIARGSHIRNNKGNKSKIPASPGKTIEWSYDQRVLMRSAGMNDEGRTKL